MDELPLISAIRTGQSIHKEVIAPNRAGEDRIFNIIATPVLSKTGGLIGGLSIIDDITEKKKAEADKQQRLLEQQNALAIESAKESLETLIDNLPHMILVKDAETMQYTMLNKVACEMLKLSAEDLIGKTVYDHHYPVQADALHAADLAASKNAGVTTLPHHEIKFPSGETRIFQTRKFAMKQSDGKRSLVTIATDQTEIIQARDQAEHLTRVKSEFLATMSHEIRTPLNGVIGMTDLVLSGPLANEQQRYMEIIKDSGNALLSIVDDILDFSKGEAGYIQIERIPFETKRAFENHLQLLKHRAAAKGLEFDYEFDGSVPACLKGDPNRILQVLNNISGNAIKFTETGHVKIKVQMAEQVAEKIILKFSVEDSGIGITNDQKERLFKPFMQADGSMARKYGGTGLGLSISKQLVELMNGQIDVFANVGTGSTFYFTITLEALTPVETAAFMRQSTLDLNYRLALNMVPQTKGSGTRRVLLAEDNQNNQILVEAYLKKLGYQPHIVSNGSEALVALQTHKYDLILMDCQMPVLDGYETTERIRSAEKATQKHIPIVALTANARAQDREKCLAVGMDDFLSKPLKRDTLAKVLAQWIPE